MKSFLIAFISPIFLWSCGPYEPTITEKKQVFKNISYDKKIIAGYEHYNDLAQLLLNNIDTIFKYKNARNYVIMVNGDKQTKQLKSENCYTFLNGNDRLDIKNIPTYLSGRADSLWTVVGKPVIELCEKQEPALVSIQINFTKRDNNILECHFLYWNLKGTHNNDSFDFVKDTSLSENCIYRIGITTDNSGW